MPAPRRFPPPWTAEDNGACFVVKDKNGLELAYCNDEEEPGRRAAANLLTRDEARRGTMHPTSRSCQNSGRAGRRRNRIVCGHGTLLLRLLRRTAR